MINKDEQLEEALMALCDMVGQHCAGGLTDNGATKVGEGLTSSDEEAIRVLRMHGYLEAASLCFYGFTDKAKYWGPESG